MTLGYRILHLTDFHWDEERSEDQKLVVGRLLADLKNVVADRKVDAIVFSGDLVNKGGDDSSFLKAKEAFLDPVRDVLQLTDEAILICPGNHDVDRPFALQQTYVEAGLLATLTDSVSLNAHFDKYTNVPFDQDDSNQRLANYFNFAKAHYNKGACFSSSYFDCVVKVSSVGKVGFAVFNSAWRSTGAGDIEQHRLLLAERAVDKAAEQLAGCDIRIAVLHHPLDWLPLWDKKAAQIPLFINFDLVLFGHVHELMPMIEQNAIGECLFAQGGSLYLRRDYFNGYQIIEISQNDDLTIGLNLRTWFDKPRRDFGAAENICAGGKISFSLRRGKDEQKKLAVQQLLELQAATDRLANSHLRTLQLSTGATFDDSFTCPPLSHKTAAELAGVKPGEYKDNLVELSGVLTADSVMVFSGARESGKTTIAWKIAKEILLQPSAAPRIPIIVDYSVLKKYDTIDRLIRRHISSLDLEIPGSLIEKNYRCVFIVDNVSAAEIGKMDRLKKLISDEQDNHDWCIFLDEADILSSKDIVKEFGATKPPIYIQPFGRGEIRELVKKISPATEIELEFADTIIKLVNDNNLPRTPYIVTLLSSVLQNASIDAAINEATLLDKMIDLLLNKQDPKNMVRSPTDFRGLNIILEQIAFWLKDEDGYLAENEVLGRLAGFLKERGIPESAATLLRHFESVGIVERYRSFQSYFLARYAASNKEFVPKLVEDNAIVRYAKEFSLLCDLSRKDADLLSYLEVIVLELQPPVFGRVDKSQVLKAQIGEEIDFVLDRVLANLSSGPQTLSKIDEIYDVRDRASSALAAKMQEEELKAPEESEKNEEAIAALVKFFGYLQAWQCWGRAITSLDFLQLSIRKPSFISLLDHWAKLASLGIEVGRDVLGGVLSDAVKKGAPLTSEQMKVLGYVVQIFLPMHAAQAVFAHIGSTSLHQLLIEAFDELDLRSPEALGAACILIKQRPPGWGERLSRYIEANIKRDDPGPLRYFILEALHQEYYFQYLSATDLGVVEGLISQLLTRAGFTNNRTKGVIANIEQNRKRIDLRTRALER